MQDTARQYIEELGFIPIPVRTKDYTVAGKVKVSKKSPIGKEWEKTTRETALFKINDAIKRHTAINLGILTGKPSNIFVIDVDAKDGGVEAWKKLIEGQTLETMTQATPSGGFHFIFKWNDRFEVFPGA